MKPQQQPVKYPRWKDSQPCHGPNHEKNGKDSIAEDTELGVVKHLGHLQKYVRTVVSE